MNTKGRRRMEIEIKTEILETMRARSKRFGPTYDLDRSHEFLVGAMQMYLLLKPESEENGAWCPPDWVFGILQGKDFRKEEE